ncbi:MAG: hypothetical protein RKL32_03380, partial [Gammaproteobacteria bacterium]
MSIATVNRRDAVELHGREVELVVRPRTDDADIVMPAGRDGLDTGTGIEHPVHPDGDAVLAGHDAIGAGRTRIPVAVVTVAAT